MKHILIILLILTTFSTYSQTVSADSQQFKYEPLNWTISIPEKFESVTASEWEKMQNIGINAVEDTYDMEVINQAKTIYVFRRGILNYLESNRQPFDEEVDGDYLQSCKGVNEIFYNTFVTQMPDIAIDTATCVSKIDGLAFQTFDVKIDHPNGMKLRALLYSRLFDDVEFSVNIMYINEDEGRKMLDAWKSSKFQ